MEGSVEPQNLSVFQEAAEVVFELLAFDIPVVKCYGIT